MVVMFVVVKCVKCGDQCCDDGVGVVEACERVMN